jgi:predicted nucleic acid-binding protein
MGKRYLIDTNVVIDFSVNRLSGKGKKLVMECIDTDPCISIITKIELLGFSLVTQEIKDFVKSSLIVGLSEEIVDETIALRKSYKIQLPDAIIALTAIVSNFALLTRNFSDFKKIKNLSVVDLYKLS